MAKHKHLTLADRFKIESMLKDNESFKSIGRELDKDCTTIAKEIKPHIYFKKVGGYGRIFNDCVNRRKCDYTNLCSKKECRYKICKNCKVCSFHCPDFEKDACEKLEKPPYVCNGCKLRQKCTLEKHLYSASFAQKEYDDIKRECRSGICISEKELLALDDIISPLVKKGHSIHHILANNRSEIMFSEKTIYNYFDKGLFSAINLDLPRKVRFKKRRSNHDSFKIDKGCRIGRTYSDFEEYLSNYPDTPIVQIDTVIGERGGKVLLTIHFVKTEFMIAFLRERNTASSVISVFDNLYERLGSDTFKRLFKVILTDNGSAFSNPLAIEKDNDGNERTKVFYCNASCPCQKGAIEVNHEFIRRIIPKGKSFDRFKQDDINKMMNHINSYKRASLGDKSPYEMFKIIYGRKISEALESESVSPNDIILTPELLK